MQFGNSNPFAQPQTQPNQPPTPQALVNQMFGCQQNFESQLQQMQARVQSGGQTPQQMVQQMLKSVETSNELLGLRSGVLGLFPFNHPERNQNGYGRDKSFSEYTFC